MHCTLCSTPLINKIDPNYYDCNTCRALVINSSLYPDTEDEKSRYLSHNNDVEDKRYQNFTSPITNYILENYSKSHLGLDFGCGTGPVITKMLREKDFKVLQYDPYFANFPENLQKSYDYIAACEVVEHFYDPLDEFRRLFNLLNKDGGLAIMTLMYEDHIDFENWHYRKDPTHVFIYRKETFEFIREKFGFSECLFKDRLIVLKK